MNNKIIKLDNETISKISAGEVILRPSNVVKELLENSIDAGADFIEIEVTKGGKDLIRVTDNGCGIGRDDLPLAIERHTTSKIRSIEDLLNTYSLGFRGEALASIAAVSRMTIISSTGETAYKMEIESGKVKSIVETASPKGTTVIVNDLFYNVPVRRKFLRSDQTEFTSITEVILRYVISNPSIHFRLLSSKRINEEYFSQTEYLTRILSIFKELNNTHIKEYDRKTDYISLKFIGGSSSITRNDNKYIYTFVNNRYVNDKILKKAIIDAYSNILPPQKYPIAFLFLKIDPRNIDVNIHPQKTEIRFKDPQYIYNEIYKNIEDILKETLTIKNIQGHIPTFTYQQLQNYEVKNQSRVKNKTIYSISEKERFFYQSNNIFEPQGFFSSLKILGQFLNRFIVLSSDKSLVIIDQHAAHERILYDKLIKGMKEESPSIQRLLIPITIEMNPILIEKLRLLLHYFNKTGFDIEIFSENTIVIKGLPVSISTPFSEENFINIISSIDEEIEKSDTENITKEIAAKIACHTSIRGERELNEVEIRRLLIDMDNTDFSITCPHGRPVFFEIDINELERRFGRR